MELRNIIFRGKRLSDGAWVVGNLFIPDRADAPTEICVGTNVVRINYDVDPATVGQYTGLTDRNGKKIFEGDILKWDEEWPGYCEVARWDYELLDMRKNDWAQFCEVIGNCWDNPELLEEAQHDD